jgi:tetratricopeptide (TPR) repeat protein
VFGVPIAHEDDALRAVRSGMAMQSALEALNKELGESLGLRLQARIGINTGEVLAGDPAEGQSFVAGEPVIIAKRLEQAARPGEILIGKATYPLVKHAVKAGPLERIPVKGKRDDVGKRRVDEIDLEAPGVARRLHAPIVGRDDELQLLQRAFDRAVEERSCRLVTVLGPPGIGKSRLAGELISSVEDRATTAMGRCLSYGEGITFWPLAEALRGLGGEEELEDALAENDRRDAILGLLRSATGVSEAAGSTEDVFWAVRRAFEALAVRRPLVVCFDDAHWAEPTLLDLVEYVVGWSRDAPILILVLARPELVEQRPHWTAPSPTWDSILLEPLSGEELESLLAAFSGELSVPAGTRARIAAAAEGNPLFAEQMVAMAAEQTDEDDLSIPPSIHALLAERLDRLTREERELIDRASVIGRDFPLAALASLSTDEQRASLTGNLLALVRKGLIRPDQSASTQEDRFSFQHVLVRDTAYEAMPKGLRATLNERFVDWLESLGRGREVDELVGYHLEQAHRHRLELGVLDDHTADLALRAADRLARAGTRALGLNDVHAALTLLKRAVALRPQGDAAVALKLDLSQALFLSGQFDAAAELAGETARRAAAAGDEAGDLRARLLRARIAAQTPREDGDKTGPSAELLAVAEQAIPVFARAGDELALTEAWFAIAWAQLIRCRFAAMLEAVEHALEHARRAGSARWEGELPAWQGSALFYGPTPVEQVLRWYEDEAAQHPVALTQQAMLEAMRGNFDEARALARSADAIAEELGQKLWLAVGGMAVWEIEMLAGDPSAAEAAVRRSCEQLEELGDTGYRATASGELATSLLALGRLDEAKHWTETAEALSSGDDVISQILWRQVRAQVLAPTGEQEDAERLAREAVALGEATDLLNWHGSALTSLAEVYASTGRADEAREQLEQALALYEQKGNIVAAARARGRLEALSAEAAPR